MKKINNFTILDIKRINKNEASLTVQINGNTEVYRVFYHNDNRVNFCDELGLILMHKDFDYHKQFLKIISDYRDGIKINLPVDIFKLPIPQKELLAA
jgi:hypothetical protein